MFCWIDYHLSRESSQITIKKIIVGTNVSKAMLKSTQKAPAHSRALRQVRWGSKMPSEGNKTLLSKNWTEGDSRFFDTHSLARRPITLSCCNARSLICYGRHVEGGLRDVTLLLSFVLCICCTGSSYHGEELSQHCPVGLHLAGRSGALVEL